MSDIDTLKNLNCPENVIAHLISVSKNAAVIADRVKIPVDRDLIKRGALLHDIGRCRTHGMGHGIEGGKILRELGFPEEIAKIAERHIGAGITSDEAEKLGLPPGDYCPKTPEEKIVAYADNITMGNKMATFDDSLERFKKMLGEGHPAIKRMEELHEEIQSWI
ncbi:TIGR00295 family protein [archaeon]|nr:TIGR00295 family protein [archaeon]